MNVNQVFSLVDFVASEYFIFDPYVVCGKHNDFIIGRILLSFSFEFSMTNLDSLFHLMVAGLLIFSCLNLFSIVYVLSFLFFSGSISNLKCVGYEEGFDLEDSSSPARNLRALRLPLCALSNYSTLMQHQYAGLTTRQPHSTKRQLSRITYRRLCLMHGMDITVYLSEKKVESSLRSYRREVVIAIGMHPRVS